MEFIQSIRAKLYKLVGKDQETTPPLLEEIRDTKLQLLAAQNHFDCLVNLDLIDACIFQIESLGVKYNYLVKQAKAQGLRYNEYVDVKEEVKQNGCLDRTQPVGNHYGILLQTQEKTC